MPGGPRVFDCFAFFNELDLLEVRLNELRSVVDTFVIAEATHTFTGKEKPLYFHENRDRFAPFLDRIVHVVVDDFPDTSSSWAREIHQRDCVRQGLTAARPDDILLLSDVDEIPRATSVADVIASPPGPNDVICFELDWYTFYMNVRLREKWVRLGPRAIRVGSLATIDGLRGVYAPADRFWRDAVRWLKAARRMKRPVRRHVLPGAGWHFSWMGGVEAVARKGGSISEHSHVRPGDKSADWARAHMDGLLGNHQAYDLIRSPDGLPEHVRAHPDRFARYFLADALSSSASSSSE